MSRIGVGPARGDRLEGAADAAGDGLKMSPATVEVVPTKRRPDGSAAKIAGMVAGEGPLLYAWIV